MGSNCNIISNIKAQRPACISEDGTHTWTIYAGGYTIYLDEYEDEVGEVYGRCRVCHDCDYIEEHVRGS